MTKKNLLLSLRLFIFTLVFFAFCGFQTSGWNFIFNSLPSPQLWLIFIVYIGYKWSQKLAVSYIYFLGFILTFYTYAPLKMVWMTLFALVLFIWFFKNRIHSNSLFFFSVLVTSSSLFFTLAYIIISGWLESNSTPIHFVHRLLEIGLNFLFSLPVYKFLHFIDNKLQPSEPWGPTHTGQSSEVEA
ncbi:MAG: hypothetical protein ACK41T_06670 [Pseudobdellovibrio sp.]